MDKHEDAVKATLEQLARERDTVVRLRERLAWLEKFLAIDVNPDDPNFNDRVAQAFTKLQIEAQQARAKGAGDDGL